MSAPTPKQILDLPMQGNDADAATVREYLVALLAIVWEEREGFSGKRPFGNSSWQYDVYEALGDAGFIRYEKDEYGGCEDVDSDAGDRLITQAIHSVLVDASPACRCADAEDHPHSQAEHTNCGSATAPCGACNNCASVRKLAAIMPNP